MLGAALVLLAACTGGGADKKEPSTSLELLLFAISPSNGTAPLQATLTAVVDGGIAPYDFAWDFENDGSFDAFTNDTFETTVSRAHQYNLRAVDAAAGSSTYQAIVRVTDAQGTVVTSEPRSITVNSSDQVVDPGTAFIEDALGNERDPATHVFVSGELLRFHFGDRSDLTYQWDFEYQVIDISKPLDQQVSPANPSFTVDSTQVSPSHVYYNTGNGPLIYIARVRVRDPRSGETAEHVFNISVAGTTPPTGEKTLVGDIFSSPAADANGVITLRFDPSGGTPGVPAEPMLELSGVVSQILNERGDPPYEFYWDYENDGKVDKAAPAATIPYFDSARSVTVNPYFHTDDERLFQVRLLVVDIRGRTSEVVRTIRSIDVSGSPTGALTFTVDWGFGSGPLLPYIQVAGVDDTQTATFTIMPRGATQIYEYKLDVDGDGLGDFDADGNLVPSNDAWQSATIGGVTVTVPFGPHPDPLDTVNDPPQTINPYPLPNYYAAQVIVRALDTPGGKQVDSMKRQTPLSLVQIGPTTEVSIAASSGQTLPAIQDMAMSGFTNTGGAGGKPVLAARGAIITGGAQGTTALRDSFRIAETFSPPINPGQDLETSNGLTYDQLTPMTVARRGHTGFIFSDRDPIGINPWPGETVIYALGGRNPQIGPLASVELMPFSVTATDMTWLISGSEITPNGASYPIHDLGQALAVWVNLGTMASPDFHRLMYIVGGFHQPSKNANSSVSALTMVFAPLVATDPADDLWASSLANLSVPRYDLSTVIIGSTLYAIGGRVSSGQSVSTVEKLDFESDSDWVQLPNMLDARGGCCAEVIAALGPSGPLPAQIYVYGGAFFPGIAGNRTLVQTAEVYNPATQTWSYTVPLKDTSNALWTSYSGGSARLPGPGSIVTSGGGAQHNTVWYFGGEVGQTIGQGETNKLCEFVYFYNVP